MTTPIAVPYFFARPPGPTRDRPGLVVVMEGNGMSQQLLRVCQRFAGEGYVVAAPDLFHRFGGSDTDRAMAETWFAQVSHADAVSDIAAMATHLRDLGVTKVGVTGFCMGGLYAYLASTSGVDVQACVPFYGRLAGVLGTPSAPLLAFFGGSDPYIPTNEIEAVQTHHPGDVVVYDGADHGFMRDGSPSYHPEAAVDAWQRTLTFLAEHLAR